MAAKTQIFGEQRVLLDPRRWRRRSGPPERLLAAMLLDVHNGVRMSTNTCGTSSGSASFPAWRYLQSKLIDGRRRADTDTHRNSVASDVIVMMLCAQYTGQHRTRGTDE